MSITLQLILGLLIVALCATTSSAQNTELAKTYMAEAERAFANGRLNDALQGVRQTEQALGKLSPNVLFLKVGILDMLVRSDMGHIQELGRALEDFFRIIDAKKYPADKLTVMLEADARHKELESGERTAFAALTPSSPIAEMQTFLARYPGSRHAADVKGMIRQAVDMKQQVETEQWLAVNKPKYTKFKRKSTALITTGAGLIVISAALFGSGLYVSTLEREFDDVNQFYVDDKAMKELTLGLMIGGGVALVAGVPCLLVGANRLVESKKIRKEARAKGIQLSVAPVVNPSTGTAMAQVQFKF